MAKKWTRERIELVRARQRIQKPNKKSAEVKDKKDEGIKND